MAPIAFEDGKTLHALDDVFIHYAMFRKQGGRTPDELTDDKLSQVGRLLARVHNVGETRIPEHRIELSPETYGLNNLDALLEGDILPLSVEANYINVVEQICEISFPWFEETDFQRVHGDCHLGNLLWGDEGPFLVDFDDTVFGPCVQDFWLLVQGRDEESRKRQEDLIASYEQMREFDRGSLRLIPALRALRVVHFSAWIAKRFKDPVFPKVFVDFGTDKYWQEELQVLTEQLELMQGV